MQTLVSALDDPRALALSFDTLYFALAGSQQLAATHKDGGGATITIAPIPDARRVVLDSDYAYVVERDNSCAQPGAVHAVTLDNPVGDVTTIAGNQNCPLTIVVDDTGIYFLNSGTSGSSDGELVRVPKL